MTHPPTESFGPATTNSVPIAIGIAKTAKQKTDQLLQLDKITPDDLNQLNTRERVYFNNTCIKILNELTGSQHAAFLVKIDQVMTPEAKSNMWEYNHQEITHAISHYLKHNGVMPTNKYIAQQTGLARQTVARHFAAYKTHPDFVMQTEQFKLMAPQVLTKVLKLALKSDMRAAKLYFEMIGANKPDAALTNTHNNYIQINNTILSQENLTRLTTEQLNQIEGIIKG